MTLTNQVLLVERDPTTADRADVDVIITGHATEYAGWTLQPGDSWLNVISGAQFVLTDAAAGTWVTASGNALARADITGTTYTVTASQSGTRFTVSNAAAVTITLPAIVEGLVFEYMRTTTADMSIKSAEAGNVMWGDGTHDHDFCGLKLGVPQTWFIGHITRVEAIDLAGTLHWKAS